MKIKSLLLSLLILCSAALTVDASQLPKEIKDYVISQKVIPSVRFDGVLVYNKNVMYLPIYPSYPKEVEKVEIVKTYPENLSMDQLPNMVLFNNNFSLLKVVNVDETTKTIADIPELPIEVKTGLLPQDIMVPRGLVLPEAMAGILGDVQIPLVGSAKTSSFISKKSAPLPTGKRVVSAKNYNVPSDLKNKLFFVNNFQTEYLQVFSSTVPEPLYSLKTSGVMKDFKPVLDGRYLLVATNNKKNLDVVDVNSEYVIKNIDLTCNPSEIVVDNVNNKAYVASISDESLSIIDLVSMSVKEKIQLVGAPTKLALSPDSTKLAYTDMKTSNIYVLDLSNEYENKLITNFPNITKMILDNNIIYMIARTKPEIRVVYFDLLQDNEISKTKKDKKKEAEKRKAAQEEEFDLIDDIIPSEEITNKVDVDEELIKDVKTYATSIKNVNVGKKPVDMYMKGQNIFVLCAGDNTVYSYNIANQNLTSEKLPVGGFSKAFTPVPNSNLAVITNMADLKYVVYDMENEKAVQTIPINDYVNMITILEREHE